jgi:hypothetical protein
MNAPEPPYELSSLSPKQTGLPFVIWISAEGGDLDHAQVKVSSHLRAAPGNLATVAIIPDVHVFLGELDAGAFELLKNWIDLNRAVLIAHWDGEIDTPGALEALTRIG